MFLKNLWPKNQVCKSVSQAGTTFHRQPQDTFLQKLDLASKQSIWDEAGQIIASGKTTQLDEDVRGPSDKRPVSVRVKAESESIGV